MFRKLFLPLSLLSLLFLSSCDINLSVSEKVPSQPTGLTASYWGSSVYLNWSDLDLNNFFGSYDVFRGSSADNLAFLTNVPLSYTYDYSPLTGTNVYAVRGTNSAGVSAFSSTATLYISTETLLAVDGATYSGELTASSQEELFYFEATATKNYEITFADADSSGSTNTGRISVSVFEEGNTNAAYLNQSTDPQQTSTTLAYKASSSGKVHIKVVPFNSDSTNIGTYLIRVKTGL